MEACTRRRREDGIAVEKRSGGSNTVMYYFHIFLTD